MKQRLKISGRRSQRRTAMRLALAAGFGIAVVACSTAPPPVEPVSVTPPPPIIIVQPIKPEPPAAAPVPVLEPQRINEEAEEALALLADMQRLVFAGADEQKRELAAATQALNRQRSDAARLRLGLLLSLPANGSDEIRA